MLLMMILSSLVASGSCFVVGPHHHTPVPTTKRTPSKRQRIEDVVALSIRDFTGGSRRWRRYASLLGHGLLNCNVSPQRQSFLVLLAASNESDDDDDNNNSSSSSSSSSSPYTHEEVEEMEHLIISLSQETTDVKRRHRVEQLFVEQLNKPNGAPKHFCNLFDDVLVIVGDRVKLQVQQMTALASDSTSSDISASNNVDPSDNNNSSDSLLPIQQTAEGWQLWALIDMMVQSKTIVKKANGELGKDGSFG